MSACVALEYFEHCSKAWCDKVPIADVTMDIVPIASIALDTAHTFILINTSHEALENTRNY